MGVGCTMNTVSGQSAACALFDAHQVCIVSHILETVQGLPEECRMTGVMRHAAWLQPALLNKSSAARVDSSKFSCMPQPCFNTDGGYIR